MRTFIAFLSATLIIVLCSFSTQASPVNPDKTFLSYAKDDLRSATKGYTTLAKNSGFFDSVISTCFPPTPPGTITTDSVVRFSYCYKNIGSQTQPDTFGFNIKITDSFNQIVYFESLRVCCLAPGEEREYDLPNFIPPTVDRFRLSFTNFQSNDSTSHDSVSVDINVVDPGLFVTSIHVVKFPQTYAEIPVVDNGPRGDDSTTQAPLPFPVVYNGHAYDTVLISTNGFVQLGDTGKLYGITMREGRGTGFQAAVHDNASDISASSNNHAFGAWWDDLNTGGPSNANGDSGHITYVTLGSSPYRVFVIQWKNMNATFDHLSDGTRINFQVRLYETTNIIDFVYGPLVAGTFVNTQGVQGASMALKDEVGGPYHYFDVFKEWFGNEMFLKTNLNPNTDWPGPNTCYRIYKNKSITIGTGSRWNLISMPIAGFNIPVCQIFSTIIGCTVWTCDSHGYRQWNTLDQGKGYFAKFASGGPVVLTGALPMVDDSVTAGWNLVGTCDHTVPAPSGGLVVGSWFTFNNGYHIATTLLPGCGYFMKSSGNGILTLGPTAAPKVAPENFDAYNSVTIKDKAGYSQTLYLRENTEMGIDLNQYDMPPVPPAGIFDIRFASGRILEAYPSVINDPVEYAVNTQALDYPVEISWNILNANGKGFALVEKQREKVVATHNMNGTGSFTMAKAPANIGLKVSTGKLIPKEFALNQNYPNPFNPTTKIQYALPTNQFVILKVYDVLGREVRTLVNETQDKGYKSVEFDATNLASGVYIYELRAGSFTASRKMLIMK